MEKKIVFLLLNVLISLSFVAASPFYYNVSLYYNHGELNIESIDVIYLTNLKQNPNGDSSLELIDANKNLIEKVNFNIPNFYIYDDFETGASMGYLDSVNFSIFVPYSQKGVEFILYNKTTPIEKKEIIEYTQPDVYKSLEKKESILEKETKSNKGLYYFLIIIIILIIISLILYLFFTKKENSNKNQPIKSI